ncbi:MAG: glycosyltransferase family 4 protein [Alphaproteobacteria bacterium]|nr:glycosyltransferase family 4 protein [Alphaproteobacteria bacterium]
MRICHVLETSGGGSAQVVHELVRYGLEQGDAVTVIYAPDRADAGTIARLSALPGVRMLASPMQRKIGPRDVADGWKLYRLLKQNGPFDIIHGHSSKAGALTRVAGLFLPGKVIYTPHGFYSMMPGTPAYYGWIEWLLSWLGPAVVSVSLGEFRHSEQLGIASRKLFLIPNGASPRFTATREEARRKLGVDEETVLFGFIGRMEPQKNPMRAIDAFAQAAADFPNARFVMLGDGSLFDAAKAERDRLGMQTRIDLPGMRQARDLIPGFDCLIGSSDFETLPISFLECLHAGVPIVTTPIGGCEEAIIEGRTGFAARDFSTAALATKIRHYLDANAAQRRLMADAALQQSSLFTADIMAAKYRDLYRRLVI